MSGFSLVELAIGLVIIGIIMGSLITPLSSLRETAKQKDASNTLKDIHDAVIGFALNNNGRLPCPSSTSSNGLEVLSGGNCTKEHAYVPAASLGLRGEFDEDNLMLDPWGNPYRYSTQTNASYQICSINDCPDAASILSSNIPAVIFSLGKEGAVTTSPDELDNTDGDSNFVHTLERGGTSNRYNDKLHWVSPNILSLYLSR